MTNIKAQMVVISLISTARLMTGPVELLDLQCRADKEKHIFRTAASEIQIDRHCICRFLPEAQVRCWLSQFLCNLFLYFMVRCVQGDGQSHSVPVVDLHHHRGCLCSLICTLICILETSSRNTFKDNTNQHGTTIVCYPSISTHLLLSK